MTYTVNHSPEIQAEVAEVWSVLQAGKLHRDARVRLANIQAGRIVRELTVLFTVAPELVDARFASAHSRLNGTEYLKFYRRTTGSKVKLDRSKFNLNDARQHEDEVPVEHLVQAKDFVAGLSDDRARQLHAQFLGTTWSGS